MFLDQYSKSQAPSYSSEGTAFAQIKKEKEGKENSDTPAKDDKSECFDVKYYM